MCINVNLELLKVINMSFDFNLKIDSNLNEVMKEKEDAIRKALEEIGLTAEAFAKQYAEKSVDTGNLRNSITHDVVDNTVVIGTNVEYAPYVELGTSNPNYPRQPYLQPAIENHIQQYKNIIETELKD